MLNHLRSHTQRLLNLLLSEPNNGGMGGDQLGIEGVATAEQDGAGFELVQEGRRKILVLLDMVDFQDYTKPTLDLKYFDLAAVEGVIKMCQVKVQSIKLLSQHSTSSAMMIIIGRCKWGTSL